MILGKLPFKSIKTKNPKYDMLLWLTLKGLEDILKRAGLLSEKQIVTHINRFRERGEREGIKICISNLHTQEDTQKRKNTLDDIGVSSMKQEKNLKQKEAELPKRKDENN